MLERLTGATINGIMNHLKMDFCMATRSDEIQDIMKRMIEVGWVTVTALPYSKRSYVYRITDKGKAAVCSANQLTDQKDPIIGLDAFSQYCLAISNSKAIPIG